MNRDTALAIAVGLVVLGALTLIIAITLNGYPLWTFR